MDLLEVRQPLQLEAQEQQLGQMALPEAARLRPSRCGASGLLAKFTAKYRATHADALREIRSGGKRSCWSWWVWPTSYRPGASGTSAEYALSDGAVRAFVGDEYLRGCWLEMMAAVAEQLEAGVSLRTLCGIDAPGVPATCELFGRAAAGADVEVAAVCARVREAGRAGGAGAVTGSLAASGTCFWPHVLLAAVTAAIGAAARSFQRMAAQPSGEMTE